MTKKNEEIMEILEAFDLTRCAWSAAELSGADAKTVQRYVGLRDAGRDPLRRTRRSRLIDDYMEKVEELVEDSRGRVRADVIHDRLRAMGYEGNQRAGRAEREAAMRMLRRLRRRRRRGTVAGDKGFDTADFVGGVRDLGLTPQIAQKISGFRGSNVPYRISQRPGYLISHGPPGAALQGEAPKRWLNGPVVNVSDKAP